MTNDKSYLLEEAFAAAGVAWWIMELPSGVVFFHPNKLAMLGRTGENFVHYKDFVNIVHPDDKEKCMKAMYDLLEGRARYYETDYRIMHKNGTYITFYDRGRITQKENEVTRVGGIVLDMSSIQDYFQSKD